MRSTSSILHLLTIWLSMLCAVATAQTDSIPLRVERLGEADILTHEEAEKRTLVRCATRSEQEIGDVMNTVFVVTSAEILQNGWVTLTDVLRNVPGIRVSQPGNALEGETFLMEGAHGNSHVEVLINDIPIRPSGAIGMPIGAQLPIRQAERIEVLYGPGGGFYGRDVPGGIVNIILKETERPLFTQADLNFGRNGYTSLDLFFGGKIGRDRNIFRFAIYGSSTVVDDRELFHANEKLELFDASRYLLEGQDRFFYAISLNFESKILQDSIANLAKMPHESRHFGINMRLRGLQLSYNRLYRRDHSSIGLGPMAASSANSQNFIGEKIETFSLGARRVRSRGGFYYTLSGVFYRIDDRSTEAWVSPMLATAFLKHIDPNGQLSPGEKEQDLIDFYGRYFFQTRYIMAASTDFRQEIRWNRQFWKKLQIEVGQVTEIDVIRPLARFSTEPGQGIGYFRNKSSFNSLNQLNQVQPSGNISAIVQAHYRAKNWQLLAARNWNLVIEDEIHASDRLFFGCSPFKWAHIRGGLARVVRSPSILQNSNTLHFLTREAVDLERPVFPTLGFLPSQKTVSGEFGLRANWENLLDVDLSFFLRQTRQFAADGYFTKLPPMSSDVSAESTYGWATDAGARREIRGFQVVVRVRPVPVSLKIAKKEVDFKFENRLYLTHSKGKTRMPGSVETLNGIAGLPENVLRFQTSILFPKTTILLRFNYESDAPTGQFFWKERWVRQSSPRDLDKGRQTVDLVFRRELSKNFQIYFTMNNVLNRNFSGLDATGTPDDLFFNPQPARQTRLGINYNMN